LGVSVSTVVMLVFVPLMSLVGGWERSAL